MLAIELGPINGPLVVFAAETGLRTNEWIAIERRDVDWSGPAIAVCRRVSDDVMTPYPKTARRRVPLSRRAAEALDRLPPRLDTPLLFPAARGGHIGLDRWRMREWIRHWTRPAFAGAAPTSFATRSRPRPWPPGSRSSSWRG
jgi:integrase